MLEFDIINKYFKPLAWGKEALGLKDDCAVLDFSNKKLVITTDSLIENQHFFSFSAPDIVATRLLVASLSDLASCGAIPKFWSFALSIPKYNKKRIDELWLDQFSKTLLKLQQEYQISLIGGDTTASNYDLMLNATLFGEIDINENILPKNKAAVGDLIYISNTIGNSCIGYELLLAQQSLDNLSSIQRNYLNTINPHNLSLQQQEYFISQYNYPNPQINLGRILQNLASACTDISDGLIVDLEQICKESKVLGVISINDITFSDGIDIKNENLLKRVITFGDDYQLVFTISKNKEQDMLKKCLEAGISVQKIGEIQEKNPETNNNSSNTNLVVYYNNKNIFFNTKGFEQEWI